MFAYGTTVRFYILIIIEEVFPIAYKRTLILLLCLYAMENLFEFLI